MPFRISFLIILFLAILPPLDVIADNLLINDITVLFSPEDNCGKAILDKIDTAEKSIELAIYHLTSRVLSKAIVSAALRGVKVRVFMDGDEARELYSKAGFLKKKGVLVKLENGEGLMHNKFCIIDDKLLITGSYNWTTSADLRNDENVIFIESKKLASLYRIQFEKYWQGAYVDESYYINKKSLEKNEVKQ